HEVYFVGIDDLGFAPGNRVLAFATLAPGSSRTTHELAIELANRSLPKQEIDLGSCDVVFLRYNPNREQGRNGHPPVRANINPAVEFGWRLRLAGTLVINDPEGIQRAGGRMYLSALPNHIRPRTLITRSDEDVKKFLRELDGPAIVKPLSGGSIENVFL